MNFWPLITILASLVLILFFRRIDKRTINLNKFKRYAQKLSDEFAEFLAAKKQDLSETLVDLENALSKASRVLAKIEESQKTLTETYAGTREERQKLDSTKHELEKLQQVKKEIMAEVLNLEKSLPSFRKISKRVKSLGLAIAEQEKLLKNAESIIPGLEKKVEEKASHAIEAVQETLLGEARKLFTPLLNEYRESLSVLELTQQKEIEKFRKKTESIVTETRNHIDEVNGAMRGIRTRLGTIESQDVVLIKESVDDLNEKVRSIQERVVGLERETVDNFIRRAEDEYTSYVSRLKSSHDVFKEELLQKVEERAKDLSTYITRLEGRVNTLLKDIKNETDKYAELLHLKAQTHESEVDALKNQVIAEINEEANKNLLLIKPLVAEVNEKLFTYKRDFSEVLEEVKKELTTRKTDFDQTMESFRKELEEQKQKTFQRLESELSKAVEQFNEVDSRLEKGISESTSRVSQSFIKKLREYEAQVDGLEGRIGNLKNITKAGQKLIEERIETVFQSYKPDIQNKLNELQEETAQLFSRHKDELVEKLNDLITRANDELQKREKEMKEFINGLTEKMNSTREKFEKSEEDLLQNLDQVKIDAREELIRELESLKGLFTEEKERELNRYRNEIAQFSEKLEQLRGEIDHIDQLLNKKIEEAAETTLEHVKQLETNYLKTGEELAIKSRKEFEEVSGEIEHLRELIEESREKMQTQLDELLDSMRTQFEAELQDSEKKASMRSKDATDFVQNLLEEAQRDMFAARRRTEELVHTFEEDVHGEREKVDKRIAEIERQINDFQKESSIIKRASKFREKVKQDIETFSDMISQLKEDKKEVLSLQKVLQTIKRDEGDISARVRQLKGDKKLIQEIARNAEKAMGLISVVEEKIALIEGERESLERIESGMKEMGAHFESLEKKADELSRRESDIEVSIETITKTKEFIENLEKRTEILKENFGEIKNIEEDLKKRLSLIDEKATSLMGNERKVEEVLSKFREMDSLVTDIETRTKQLQTTREWLARTESRLTNLSADAQKLLDQLTATLEKAEVVGSAGGIKGSGLKGGAGSREAESKVKTVLTLFEQKWTIPEICRVTKMSRGEVELILELNK